MSKNDNVANDRTARIRPFILLPVLFVFCIILSNREPVVFAAERGAGTARLTRDDTNRLTGLCIQIGGSLELTRQLAGNPQLLLHRLDVDLDLVKQAQGFLTEHRKGATLLTEHWTRTELPHANNLVNVVIASKDTEVPRTEILRVLCPGGVAFFADDTGYTRIEKPKPEGLDAWTHQWHGADGGLVTEDTHVGVPQGLQWVTGPLFAMAGRKSSTQSLVSAGGRNFYVTQNVVKNVGRGKMHQFLVARDAFNGLLLWQRQWTGPFVTGNGETNPRLVASGQYVYIVDDGHVLALDAQTGKTRFRWETAEDPDKLIHVGHTILVQSPGGITALDDRLDEVMWKFRDKKTHGTASVDDQVLCLVSGRSKDGNFKHELVGINLSDGKIAWRVNTQPQTTARRVRINFARDGFVALQSHGSLHLFSAKSGDHLWTRKTDAKPGKSYVDERFVGHFLRHGLVWMLKQNSERKSSGQNEWLGLDPLTGEQRRVLQTTGDWPKTATPGKMGCQLLVASDRFIMIPRQATFIDFETGEKRPFKFTRGGCGLGFVPANGLVYSHPHACGCFSEAVRGFMGMHSQKAVRFESSGTERVERGAAFKEVKGPPTVPEDWPVYRYDGSRGASSPTQLDDSLSLLWSKQIVPHRETRSSRAWTLRTGNRLTAPTIYDRSVFVADVDSGQLHALDVASGHPRWTFSAAGRIDSPPTLHNGLCLFGSHNGYVYCVSAADGRLVWRFRAAPMHHRIVAFGNVESRWPVSGTVLVQDDTAFVAAGRAPDADGGIQVHALDLQSGNPLWSAQLNSPESVGLCDFLVSGEEDVFLSNWRFDPQTGEHARASSNSHLRGGKVGLLEASWLKHDLALRKNIQTWTAKDVAGQLLAFSRDETVRYEAESRTLTFKGQTTWNHSVPKPAQVTSLILTKSHVVAAGSRDRQAQLAEGILWLLDEQDGAVNKAIELPAEVVFDGLAASRNQVFVSSQNGHLYCFGSKKRASTTSPE